ncbi:DUF6114 domain-containing protein [Actinoplanes sp. NPDC020271]|uniref:DUF6114 domain-containing protein n=1 Tax=Actinoplanes sp. NPDC020271 TaxID=3363896 RepID=UPI0037BBDDAA
MSGITHHRASPGTRAWRGFRDWRRTRPFWGGLFVLLGGAEILFTVWAPLGVVLHVGMQNFIGYLVPWVIVILGVLLLFNPAQRIFYSLIALLCALGSFITSNMGGFILGLLFTLVGSALSFAWAPSDPEPVTDSDPTSDLAPVASAVDPAPPGVVAPSEHPAPPGVVAPPVPPAPPGVVAPPVPPAPSGVVAPPAPPASAAPEAPGPLPASAPPPVPAEEHSAVRRVGSPGEQDQNTLPSDDHWRSAPPAWNVPGPGEKPAG